MQFSELAIGDRFEFIKRPPLGRFPKGPYVKVGEVSYCYDGEPKGFPSRISSLIRKVRLIPGERQ